MILLKQRKQLENKLEEGQVFVEFEQVYKKKIKFETGIANQPDNKDRNRFKDVLPYDENRVKLMPRKDNPTGYINASHVKVGDDTVLYLYISSTYVCNGPGRRIRPIMSGVS